MGDDVPGAGFVVIVKLADTALTLVTIFNNIMQIVIIICTQLNYINQDLSYNESPVEM